jgi:YHS domain-containing protein
MKGSEREVVTMTDLAGLQQQLAALRDDEAKRRSDERSARAREMQDLETRRAKFERVVGGWLADIVLPRLKALAETLPHPGKVAPVSAAFHARVEFAWTEQFPVSASLTVSFMPDARFEHARMRVEPLLIPMLEGHPPAANGEYDLEPTAIRSLTGLLDREVLVFARSYLHVRDPDSPYLRHKWVTDPVCGMTIHPSDAVETWVHEGREYSFCSTACAMRFRQDPEHYLEAWRPYMSTGV